MLKKFGLAFPCETGPLVRLLVGAYTVQINRYGRHSCGLGKERAHAKNINVTCCFVADLLLLRTLVATRRRCGS
jgi:hypothetical protein